MGGTNGREEKEREKHGTTERNGSMRCAPAWLREKLKPIGLNIRGIEEEAKETSFQGACRSPSQRSAKARARLTATGSILHIPPFPPPSPRAVAGSPLK